MREIARQLRGWRSAGHPFAVAMVVGVRGSAPRQPGAAMAVNDAGSVVGSVSGGCVEGAVYELACEVLRDGEPRLATYGISDGDAFAVGLTCGGVIDILVLPGGAEVMGAVVDALVEGRPVAWATVIGGGGLGRGLAVFTDGVVGSFGVEGLDAAVVDDGQGMLAQGATGTRHYGAGGERRRDDVAVFVQSFRPAPRMLVFGAIDFAAAVTRVGALLGYRVTVCDARAVFATRQRFPDADEVVCEWPAKYLARTKVDATTV
ncbi:MAG: XdhC family protein, partial [Frankia sp.]